MTTTTMWVKWNNQGAAHFGFHELWILMTDGWHRFDNDQSDSSWWDNGVSPATEVPNFTEDDWKPFKFF